MKILIDSISVEKTPNDNSPGFHIYGYDHDNNKETADIPIVKTALFEPQFKYTYMPYSDFGLLETRLKE